MPSLRIRTRAAKFISVLNGKHAKQVAAAVKDLAVNPTPHDSKAVIGFPPLQRKDVGEYLVVFWYNENNVTVIVVLVGKRNGDEVYQELRRMFQGGTISAEDMIASLRS
jgi:mRNA-degrading endonuclease RelE of RelBE toxin-antitoxin system